MKQPDAEQPFRFLDLLGERGRSDLQFLGRPREVQVLGDASDTADMAKFELSHSIAKRVNYFVIL
jgi:hypothetical protein